MTDEEIHFYEREKTKFDELIKKFGWTEEYLVNEQKPSIQCPIDQNHRFPIGSKHPLNCQLVKEGFSKNYLKELEEYEQEKRLLNQSGISFPPSKLSHILQRPIPIINDFPLNTEQTTVLFTPHERCLIAQSVHNEAMRLGLVPSTPSSISENQSTQSQNVELSQQLDKLAELRDQKRRRTKYVTRPSRKSFYDIAREMINTEMQSIQQQQQKEDCSLFHKDDKHRKKHKHRSSRSDSRKHHRHSKKRRKS